MIVAIDTMIMIWGVRKKGEKDKITRATWLFDELSDKRAQVILPSVSLAEYLAASDPSKYSDIVAPLSTRFFIAPFDVQCAGLAAKLFRKGKEEREMDVEDSRNMLKADSLIVATAAVHGASMLYSHDAQCRQLASHAGRLRAADLPEIGPDLWSM